MTLTIHCSSPRGQLSFEVRPVAASARPSRLPSQERWAFLWRRTALHAAPPPKQSCFEAGRDGFWLHRLLPTHGVINHVLEPTSVWVTCGARRAKTDRLPAVGLLRVLVAKFAGDPGPCQIVNLPTVEEEDAKRPHREREFPVQERVRIENRIAALLVTQGVRKRPSLRSWSADMRASRTGDGRPMPSLPASRPRPSRRDPRQLARSPSLPQYGITSFRARSWILGGGSAGAGTPVQADKLIGGANAALGWMTPLRRRRGPIRSA